MRAQIKSQTAGTARFGEASHQVVFVLGKPQHRLLRLARTHGECRAIGPFPTNSSKRKKPAGDKPAGFSLFRRSVGLLFAYGVTDENRVRSEACQVGWLACGPDPAVRIGALTAWTVRRPTTGLTVVVPTEADVLAYIWR